MLNWKKWYNETGIEILKRSGVKPGDYIIDFGSGQGDYSIPAAILAGKDGAKGKVFAIDKKSYNLEELKNTAEKLELANLETMENDGGLSIDMEKKLVDVVLAFDVLHYFTGGERSTLYNDIYRVLKPNGLLITFPNHHKGSYPLWNLSDMSLEEIIDEIESHGYKHIYKWEGKLMHDHNWYNGSILSFEKVNLVKKTHNS